MYLLIQNDSGVEPLWTIIFPKADTLHFSYTASHVWVNILHFFLVFF